MTEDTILITPTPAAAGRVLAEHKSQAQRARAALRRVYLDPKDYPGLVREIAKEIWEAEQHILKGCLEITREVLTE